MSERRTIFVSGKFEMNVRRLRLAMEEGADSDCEFCWLCFPQSSRGAGLWRLAVTARCHARDAARWVLI